MNDKQQVQIIAYVEVAAFATGVWSLGDSTVDLAAILFVSRFSDCRKILVQFGY